MSDNRFTPAYIAKWWPRAIERTLIRVLNRHVGSFPPPSPSNDNRGEVA